MKENIVSFKEAKQESLDRQITEEFITRISARILRTTPDIIASAKALENRNDAERVIGIIDDILTHAIFYIDCSRRAGGKQ
jgi:hypothetical protein